MSAKRTGRHRGLATCEVQDRCRGERPGSPGNPANLLIELCGFRQRLQGLCSSPQGGLQYGQIGQRVGELARIVELS